MRDFRKEGTRGAIAGIIVVFALMISMRELNAGGVGIYASTDSFSLQQVIDSTEKAMGEREAEPIMPIGATWSGVTSDPILRNRSPHSSNQSQSLFLPCNGTDILLVALGLMLAAVTVMVCFIIAPVIVD